MKTLLLTLFFFTSLSLAVEIQLKSQETQTQVIELYTSEGCSSCPPADRWLSSLKNNSELFKSFIPIALHVDYWDYIGWTDALAFRENSQRQRLYKHLENLNSVYTPGILKAGKEWRGWYSTGIKASNDQVGILNIDIVNNNIKAKFDTKDKSEYRLVVALLGMDIQTKVMAGENHGKLLKHDFVMLKKESFEAPNGQWNETIDDDFFQSKYQNTVFVAWVEKTNNPAPIQAVGTFL
ncbi:MAG: DUF1223 domain-containing protein [Marinicellaceae bacterium]